MNFTALASAFDSVASAVAPMAIAGLWQGLVVACALTLCLKFAHRISAAHRFALGFAAFVAVAALPLASRIVPASGHANAPSTMAVPAAHAWLQFDSRWTFAIAALWLIASLARATDLVLHVARLRRLWRGATPVDIPQLPGTHTRAFEVCSTPQVDRPSVIGFFAPRVLIPDWLLQRLTSEELHQIVLHESTHLTRRDDWTNLFQKLCLVLFPLNPALFWLDRQLAQERERSCDEAVVRITRAPRAYAACLASLAERGLAYRKEALSLGAWRRRSELVDRVHRILGRNRLMHPAAARILLGALGCGLLVVTIELASCPQLVAFVPAARAVGATAFNNPSAQLGDAIYPTKPPRDALTPGAHIVQARAIMPSASPMKPFAGRARMKPRPVGELRAASSEPGVSPRDLADQQTKSQSGAPQLVVFTAWEQVEITSPANQIVADYDTNSDTDADPSRDAGGSTPNNTQSDVNASRPNNARPDPNPSAPIQTQRRATFTQLILRVAPAGAKSSQPTAIPIGDGWFVIQL
jgi:beta-lactamase regulating signal transducer with metallopeptidase domain